MKTLFLSFIFLSIIAYNQNKNLSFTSTKNGFDAQFTLNKFNFTIKSHKEGNFILFNTPDFILDGKIGEPALPTLKKLIEIPIDGDIEITIVDAEEHKISLAEIGFKDYLIWPQQPSLRKDQDPEKVPFYFNRSVYASKNFIEHPLVHIEKIGIARNIGLGRLIISPFVYNPSTGELKYYTNITFSVRYKNFNEAKNISFFNKYYSPLFDYQFKNLAIRTNTTKDLLTQYPIVYLIISDRMFQSTLQPFIQWKTRQGYKVIVAYTDSIGNTTTSIKNYISSIYNNATPQQPAPTYLLLVGDVEQIPTFNGTTGSHPTDTYYATMNGSNDYIPDIYIGRMSASNTNQLQSIVNKTLEFEQYLMPDPSYLQYALMIAGVDVNFAPTYGNGQINYATQYYFNINNGIISHTYLYGSGSPITSDNPQAESYIIQNINDGVGFANYTAHCSSSGWADPTIETSNITNFTNEHKYGVFIGNCCQSNKFNETECFGEAITRAVNKGAVAYIGASDYSYWIEDYYYSVGCKPVSANPTYDATKLGFYDKLFHQFNEPESEWFISAAQINYAGNLAVEQGGSNNVYYWEIYHLMGDPSLLPYLGIPSPLNVNYQNPIPLGTPSITINTEDHAYVGLSLNNSWIDAKYTGNGTSVTLNLSSITSPCTLDLVITKQHRQPYIGTLIIIPNNGPYVIYNNHTINDTGIEVNSKIEYSETVNLTVTLSNVGIQDAYGVSATLSTSNPHIHIIQNTANFGNIAASNSSTINNAFSFWVDTVITDQETATFTITITDDQNNSWNSNFNITLFAPALQASTILINDASGNNNGRLDPGENAVIKILTHNFGHAITPPAIATLMTNSTYVTINNNAINLNTINAGDAVYAEFPISIAPSAPLATTISFVYNVNASGYLLNKLFSLTIGLIVEDFETGNFTKFPWDTTTTHSGDAPWIIINNGNIFEGNYAARSGVIPNGSWFNNTYSDLNMSIVVLSPDTLSFYRRVSSEENYDFLQFFIDNTKLNEWSGEKPWQRFAYYLSAGPHNLKWRYTKDYSVSSGDDAGFIDYIVFPPIDLPLNKPTLNEDFSAIMIYPNPCSDVLILTIISNTNETFTVKFYDQVGKLLPLNYSGIMNVGKNTISLNTSSLSTGVYFLKVNTPHSSQTLKVTVIK